MTPIVSWADLHIKPNHTIARTGRYFVIPHSMKGLAYFDIWTPEIVFELRKIHTSIATHTSQPSPMIDTFFLDYLKSVIIHSE